jgi:hypothetical protein
MRLAKFIKKTSFEVFPYFETISNWFPKQQTMTSLPQEKCKRVHTKKDNRVSRTCNSAGMQD